MNPDNFKTKKTQYDLIWEEETAIGKNFWDKTSSHDLWIEDYEDKLYSRVFTPHPSSHLWMIGIHGYRTSGIEDVSYVAYQFSKNGYNCLIPDLKAHGKSSGKIIGMGWPNRLEVLLWIDEVIKIDPHAKIILYGGSMGASTIMMASGETLPANIKGLVADCGYSSVYEEFASLLSDSYHLPSFPILSVANILAKYKVGFYLKDASAVKMLQKNYLPALFIHGSGDRFVPPYMLQKNYLATQGYSQKMLVPKAPHLSSFIYQREPYFETVFDFINTHCIGGVTNEQSKNK